MNAKLPPEIRKAIEQNPLDVRLEDEETNAVYFIMDEATHRRAMLALKEQEDNRAIGEGLRQMEQGEGKPFEEVDRAMRSEFPGQRPA
ncbi:MAG: hypothetical protein DWQ31_11145 [Planctomycetota bacterium]|nr:MAG: hypothetical protein DWQ31_11145 [Planctomycetota bacterium]REJ94434.1 MAG: hypothetical protein DWQ35_08545 [Planctomycetota bacterium]REK22031.1 MAG: hypothetical protein DWQ42_17980 [Planctomycetota bacterium]REK44439.1 MAG: hypothetical protein DWQ46_09265 [Planctomycetota bacterium]